MRTVGGEGDGMVFGSGDCWGRGGPHLEVGRRPEVLKT